MSKKNEGELAEGAKDSSTRTPEHSNRSKYSSSDQRLVSLWWSRKSNYFCRWAVQVTRVAISSAFWAIASLALWAVMYRYFYLATTYLSKSKLEIIQYIGRKMNEVQQAETNYSYGQHECIW